MHTQRSLKKPLGTANRNSIEMGRTSFCNFVFIFLGTKGTIVFYCSEILGQLDVVQDSSVVGPESLLLSRTGSVCVHMRV